MNDYTERGEQLLGQVRGLEEGLTNQDLADLVDFIFSDAH